MTATPLATSLSSIASTPRSLPIALPEPRLVLDQDEEWFLARVDGRWEEFRMHDYDRIFAVPGLYERVVYDVCGCRSPEELLAVLEPEITRLDLKPAAARALDLGAGNGYFGALLREIGFERIVGCDLEPMAKVAAERDRPDVYEAYAACDITRPDEPCQRILDAEPFDLLTCVAALGFGDIPPAAFDAAARRVREGGLIAITIKDEFMQPGHEKSGFAEYLKRQAREGRFVEAASSTFQHRVSLVGGEPIEYRALVYRVVR